MALQAVRVRGPFHGPSGYDHHVRAFVRHLDQAGIAVQLVDFPFWSKARLPRQLQDPWFDSLRRDVGARVFLQFCMPHQLTSRSGMINVNFTMFEASRVPHFWINGNQGQCMTVVPEESSRRCWLASGMPAEFLRVCPLGIDPELFAGNAEPLPLRDPVGELVGNRRVRFLNLSEIVPRKNLEGLLRAWLVATSREDDAILILKPRSELAEDHAGLRDAMTRLELEEGKPYGDAAPIIFFNVLLSDEDMPRVYATATHYISMSHGEGWDLPMMEAAASGLLLIAPDHTAYQTYLDRSVATLIPSREVPSAVPGEHGILFAGASWWEPDRDAAVEAIREAIRGFDRPIASPRDFVLGHWTWEHATARLVEILTEAEESSRPAQRH
jgi:glycosyltransferase involved in cell wall biosynthesis